MIGTEQIPRCPDCHGPMVLRRPIRKDSPPEYYCPECDEQKTRLRIRRDWESRNARLMADMAGAYCNDDVWEPALWGA
jgi:ssDNA-binding Zn-finger/Zn-ribbon topoisomerase 1